MTTRTVVSVIFIAIPALLLGNPIVSGEGSQKSKSKVEENIKGTITISGELQITDKTSPSKKLVDPDKHISGDLKLTVGSTPTAEKHKSKIKLWAGYSYYKMSHFNDKLSLENNKTISRGLNIGIEATPKKFSLDVSKLITAIPLVDLGDLELPTGFPIGLEYLEAKSRTIHAGNTTVNWELPVMGVYISPEITFPGKDKDQEGFSLKLRPLGVGYYTLGKPLDAKLMLTGAPGHLKVSGDAIGTISLVALTYKQTDYFEIFIEGGYRWLEFTDVLREPKGGFAGGAPAGQLPEDLDYSGPIIRAGLVRRF